MTSHFPRNHCSSIKREKKRISTKQYPSQKSSSSMNIDYGETALTMHCIFCFSHEKMEIQGCNCIRKGMIDLISIIFMKMRLCFIHAASLKSIKDRYLPSGRFSQMFPEWIWECGTWCCSLSTIQDLLGSVSWFPSRHAKAEGLS